MESSCSCATFQLSIKSKSLSLWAWVKRFVFSPLLSSFLIKLPLLYIYIYVYTEECTCTREKENKKLFLPSSRIPRRALSKLKTFFISPVKSMSLCPFGNANIARRTRCYAHKRDFVPFRFTNSVYKNETSEWTRERERERWHLFKLIILLSTRIYQTIQHSFNLHFHEYRINNFRAIKN